MYIWHTWGTHVHAPWTAHVVATRWTLKLLHPYPTLFCNTFHCNDFNYRLIYPVCLTATPLISLLTPDPLSPDPYYSTAPFPADSYGWNPFFRFNPWSAAAITDTNRLDDLLLQSPRLLPQRASYDCTNSFLDSLNTPFSPLVFPWNRSTMAKQAWNDLMTRIGYTAKTWDYLYSAAGINSPSTVVEATTLLGFDKFIDGLDKKARASKPWQIDAWKPSKCTWNGRCYNGQKYWQYGGCRRFQCRPNELLVQANHLPRRWGHLCRFLEFHPGHTAAQQLHQMVHVIWSLWHHAKA